MLSVPDVCRPRAALRAARAPFNRLRMLSAIFFVCVCAMSICERARRPRYIKRRWRVSARGARGDSLTAYAWPVSSASSTLRMISFMVLTDALRERESRKLTTRALGAAARSPRTVADSLVGAAGPRASTPS